MTRLYLPSLSDVSTNAIMPCRGFACLRIFVNLLLIDPISQRALEDYFLRLPGQLDKKLAILNHSFENHVQFPLGPLYL